MHPRRGTRAFVGGALLLLMVFVAFWRGWLGPVESGVLSFLAPVTRALSTAGREMIGVVGSFARIGTLGRTVRILQEENARLQSLVARLEGVEEENAVLREQLKLLPRASFRLVTADVIGRSTDGVTEALIINRGTNDNVDAGMPAIVNEGIVVGRVQKAERSSATVVLLADPSFRVAGETLGTKAQGLVRGARGLEIIMDTIPQTSEVKVGDRVITTGTDGIFPPNLLIGTIRSVDAPGNDIFQSATITPLVNLHRARIVSVILP